MMERPGYGVVLENIRRLIAEKGLKQKFVASSIGMTEQEFSNLMTGRMLLRVEHVPEIAKALGVTPNDIYGV